MGGTQKGIFGVFLVALIILCPCNTALASASVRVMDASEKVVYLTFDDGPDVTNTINVMETLLKYGAKGTFFFTGVNMDRHPDVVKKVYDNGFTIGLHSYAHSSLAKMSAEGIKKDLDAANDVLERITGERSAIVRPPYGDINASAMKTLDSLGFTSYLWAIDPKDWSNSQTDAGALKNIKDNLKPGAIILLHSSSGHSRAGRILPQLIEYIRSEGYEMKALPDPGCKTVEAAASKAGFAVDGAETFIQAFVVNGGNYVGARDLAIALYGTAAQFDVIWDAEKKSVIITKGRPYLSEFHYEAPDTEQNTKKPAAAAAARTRAKPFDANVIIDGTACKISAQNINGSSYYSLRELAGVIGAEVGFDAGSNLVNIKCYK